MSNAMSRSKSRWKAALLATVATAVVSPMAANATMTINLSLSPLGGTAPKVFNYLTPDTTNVPIYVYATITGAADPGVTTQGAATQTTTGNFDGIQYAYYNVVNSGATPVHGNFSGGALNATLGFNSNTPDIAGMNISGAAQTGTLQNAVGSVSVGSLAGTLTDYAKPRAGQPIWSNAAKFNSGTGTFDTLNNKTDVVAGAAGSHSVSFLLETLTYSQALASFNASAPGGTVYSTAFSITVPTLPTGYAPANYFTDAPTTASPTSASLAPYTSSNYSIGTSVTLENTVKGDANADGVVGFADLSLVLSHYGASDTLWKDGNFLYSTNTSNPAFATINFGDLSTVLSAYGANLGTAPHTVVADGALLADPAAVAALESVGITPVAASSVPEPVSLGVVGILAAAGLGRRRRRA